MKNLKRKNLWKWTVESWKHRKTSPNVFNSLQLTKNDVEFLPIKITWKKVSTNNAIFQSDKLHWKSTWKIRRFFRQSKLNWKNWKQRGFFDQGNYTDKSTWKQRGFFCHRNYIEKVRENNVGFSTSKILSKNNVEMAWKFGKILSWTYRCNIDVELTWIRRGVSVGIYLLF